MYQQLFEVFVLGLPSLLYLPYWDQCQIQLIQTCLKQIETDEKYRTGSGIRNGMTIPSPSFDRGAAIAPNRKWFFSASHFEPRCMVEHGRSCTVGSLAQISELEILIDSSVLCV